MSAKSGAKVAKIDDDDLLNLIDDIEVNMLEPAIFIGEPIDGGYVFLVVHECPFCHGKMQTMGVGHGVYYCSHCASARGRSVEMTRTYERLEVLE